MFTHDELQEINGHDIKLKPQLPNDFKEYINSFAENDCTKLRQKLDTKWPWQENYDMSKHGDYDWLRNTVYNLVREYEALLIIWKVGLLYMLGDYLTQFLALYLV
ncbi:unnamed protein product [Absidia cylindrospora]